MLGLVLCVLPRTLWTVLAMSSNKHIARQQATRALVRELLGVALGEISAADAVVRQNHREGVAGSPKSIKKLRIAFRRIQYELSTMSEVDKSLDTKALTGRLREVGRPLGRLRDVEVLVLRVTKVLGERAETPVGTGLLEVVGAALEPARTGASALLDSLEYAWAISELHALRIALPGDGVELALTRSVAARAVRNSWHSLECAAKRSLQNPNDDNLHALRISGKRMVYVTKGLSEVLGVVGGEDVTEHVTVLQKFLGRQHDHVVTALAMGRVGMGNPYLKDLADTLSAEELKSADDYARAWVPLWEAVQESHLRRSLLGG